MKGKTELVQDILPTSYRKGMDAGANKGPNVGPYNFPGEELSSTFKAV